LAWSDVRNLKGEGCGMARSYKTDYLEAKKQCEDLVDQVSRLEESIGLLNSEIEQSKSELSSSLTNYNSFKEKQEEVDGLYEQYHDSFAEILGVISRVESNDENLISQVSSSGAELNRLRRLNNRANKLLNKATTYSLGESFEKRRKSLEVQLGSQKAWLLGSMSLILIVIGYLYYDNPPKGLSDSAFFFLKSISFSTPLIWISSIFSRNYYQLLQLEEFYAQKVAMALAYTGYKEEIEELSKGSEDFKALLKLMNENLAMIAKPSDEIFSRKTDQSPYQKFLDKLLPS